MKIELINVADVVTLGGIGSTGLEGDFLEGQGLGIAVYRENFGRLKGMYRVIHRRRC